MSLADEIRRIEQLRAELMQKRERHLKRLDDKLKGKPLPKGTARLLSNQVYVFNRKIAMYERQIERLSAGQGA